MRNETFSPSDAWRAVAERDGRFDGRFVYAVRTTRIYCRPSCPSRRPAERNVDFFDGPEAAERAGYRACKRCRPRDITPGAGDRVERARRWIDGRVHAPVRLADVARAVDTTPTALQREFTRIIGMSPKAYHAARRAERLRAELRKGGTVSRAIFEAGYGSGSRVYEKAAHTLGMTPGSYRRGGAGTTIRYATVSTSVGRLLVAATDRGVCSVALGSDEPALERMLRAEFPEATIAVGGAQLRDWVTRIVDRIEGRGRPLDVPLDVQGTTFQWLVWRALQQIPRGETRSYGEIAREIGRPTASRAVARACASNRAAIVIPCHRVVREDGAPGGYRWGAERKARLISVERGE
jgi:AraC family transcriptional regulator of adaptative response/methylated-DNA-[protein]-cysteine methyltransferase